MGDCCTSPKRVLVEFEYLAVGGATCDRCGDTRQAVRAAVADARRSLPSTIAEIDLVERELAPDRLADSNRVLVNGRPAEEWLGGASVMSDCPSCGDLVGEPVCCREIEIGGIRTEAVGRDVVFDAIMAAADLGADEPAAASCCAPVSHTVTLVTGPGCG